MNPTRSLWRIMALSLAAAGLLLTGICGNARAQAAPTSVEALLYTTMPSTTAHRPEMAMDGDQATYFRSAYGMSDGDTFLVLLSQAIPVQSLTIITGDADHQDLLTSGIVETSADGTTYQRVASFGNDGVAKAVIDRKPVRAVRIRLLQGTGVPALIVREIAIDSPIRITHVQ